MLSAPFYIMITIKFLMLAYPSELYILMSIKSLKH